MVRTLLRTVFSTSAIALAALMAVAGDGAGQSVSVVVPPAGPARDAFQALEEGRYKDADAAFGRALTAAPDDPAVSCWALASRPGAEQHRACP